MTRRWHRHLNEIVAEKDAALVAERDRVRRECAEELRAKLTSGPMFAPYLEDLAESWSTPDPSAGP